MNQKGFAISTILYAMITMASLILFILVADLSFEKKSKDDLVESVEKELNQCVQDKTC